MLNDKSVNTRINIPGQDVCSKTKKYIHRHEPLILTKLRTNSRVMLARQLTLCFIFQFLIYDKIVSLQFEKSSMILFYNFADIKEILKETMIFNKLND